MGTSHVDKISSVKSFLQLLDYFDKVPFPNSTIYRGQANCDWSLLPKSGRKEFSNKYSRQFTEKEVFESWRRYATHFLTKEPKNDWEWLALAQHHGLATRLLDWSKNPLTATYFAVSESFDTDSAVFFCEVEKDDNPIGDDPFAFNGFRVFFPSGWSARILSQRGVFTITGTPSVPLEKSISSKIRKIIVSKNCKIEILKTLDRFGVNPLTIFQDLDGLSNYLNAYLQRMHSKEDLHFSKDQSLPMG